MSVNRILILTEILDGLRTALVKEFPNGGGGEVVGEGFDGTPTKRIDRFAEDYVLNEIERRDLKWSIISEECDGVIGDSDWILILDPIDGTYNAVHGIPVYSCSMALSFGTVDDIRYGAVSNLATGDIFTAEIGKGAKLNGTSITTRPFDPKRSVFSSYVGPDSIAAASRVLSSSQRVRYLGSISLETCFVASGALDLFSVFERVPRITDIAAAKLILQEAGGSILSVSSEGDLTEYRLGDRNNNRKGVLAVGDTSSLDIIKNLIQKTMIDGTGGSD